jgi:hypothetical protein
MLIRSQRRRRRRRRKGKTCPHQQQKTEREFNRRSEKVQKSETMTIMTRALNLGRKKVTSYMLEYRIKTGAEKNVGGKNAPSFEMESIVTNTLNCF